MMTFETLTHDFADYHIRETRKQHLFSVLEQQAQEDSSYHRLQRKKLFPTKAICRHSS